MRNWSTILFFAELMTRFVYEGVDYVANEADSDAMVMPAPAAISLLEKQV